MSVLCQNILKMTMVSRSISYPPKNRQYFRNVMKRGLLLIVLILLFGLHFTKAQSLKIRSFEGKPLEGAVVLFATLAGHQQAEARFTDNQGEVNVPAFPYPMVRKVNLIGYVQHIDTVNRASDGIKVIIMNSANIKFDEITVTGSYLPGYQSNSVYNIDVINRKDIEQRAANNVKDLLSQEMNVNIANDGVLGSSMSIQGTGGQNVKFLIDGIPVIGRQNGNIDISQLNLSNIERVEIVKGPMSVLYGSDALGGVVNLITKNSSDEKLTGSLTSYYENVGHYNLDANVGWGFKKRSLSLDIGRNFFAGWSENDSLRSQQWNPKEQYYGNFKYSGTINGYKMILQSSVYDEKVINKGNPIITPYFAYANDQNYLTRRITNAFSTDKRINDKSSWQMNLAYSYYRYVKNTYIKNMVTLSEQLTADPADDDTTVMNGFFGRAVYNHNFSEKLALLTGFDLNSESAVGKKIDNTTHSMTDIAAYASLDYKPFQKLTFRPSVRGIYNSQFNANVYDVNISIPHVCNYGFGLPFVPSLNVLYKPCSTISVRASWSKGFRAPSIKEQYLYFVDISHNVRGNSDLKAERSDNFNFFTEFKKAFGKKVFSIEPALFYNNITDQISLVEVDAHTALYTYVNLDEFISKGCELKARLATEPFQISGGAAYTGTWSTFEGDLAQPEITWYSEFNGSADYKFTKMNLILSTYWRYISEKPVYLLVGQSELERTINQAYQLIDFSVRKPFAKDHFTLSCGVKNILDVTNVRASSTGGAHSGGNDGTTAIGMGRSYFVKIIVSL